MCTICTEKNVAVYRISATDPENSNIFFCANNFNYSTVYQTIISMEEDRISSEGNPYTE